VAVEQTTEHMRPTESFEAFYRREYRPVLGLAIVLTGDRWEAEDVTQDAFIAAERSWDKIGRYDKPEAWVRRVLANISVSRFRRRLVQQRVVASLPRKATSNRETELSAETAEVWDAVRHLPKRQAVALALTYLDDWPLEQVADVLGCSPGTVKTHLRRGRATVARRLGAKEVAT
jgi:RNA polymerase sigma-70 factor (ECF subfamily)